MREGKTGTIKEISGGRAIVEKLNAMGIRPGEKIRKVSVMRNGGPVVILCGRTQLALGRGMAEKILVKEDRDGGTSGKNAD